MKADVFVSFITTCKNRLGHLKQAVPLFAAQVDAECIVVDYDCPEHAADWCEVNHPSVRVVRVPNEPEYHQSRARNLGAGIARGRWFFFVDADVLIAPGFVSNLVPLLRAGGYYRPIPGRPEAWGTVACARKDFVAVEGYDEIMQGYGYKETDFYTRLELHGCELRSFPGEWLTIIRHDSVMRTQYYEIKDRWLNRRINMLYSLIKRDLALQQGSLDISMAQRRIIYQQVRATVLRGAEQGASASTVTIQLPESPAVQSELDWRIRRQWTYRLEPDDSVSPEMNNSTQ